MPSDPTPTEAEMREATEWYTAKYPHTAQYLNRPLYRTIRDAYAAALAKCRVEVDEKCENAEKKMREWCANVAWDTINRLYPDGSMHDLQEEINSAILGGGA